MVDKIDVKNIITASQAIEMLMHDKQVSGYHITETINIDYKSNAAFIFELESCIVENLDIPSVAFEQKVTLRNCIVKNCRFNYTWFLGGLLIDGCKFEKSVDFEAGGHNEQAPFIIKDSVFSEFVSFFDCWFKSDVIVTNNKFLRGTDLMGNREKSFRVHFDKDPLITNNEGEIDCSE